MANDETKPIIAPDYLGDGVYVEFDGFRLILKANDFNIPTDVIVLEPSALAALNRYVQRIKDEV